MKMTLCQDRCWKAVTAGEVEVLDKEMDIRALSTIVLSLEKTNYSLVMDAITAKEAWGKLKSEFTDDRIRRRIGLHCWRCRHG